MRRPEKVLKKASKGCHLIQKLLNLTLTATANQKCQELTQESQVRIADSGHVTAITNNKIKSRDVSALNDLSDELETKSSEYTALHFKRKIE